MSDEGNAPNPSGSNEPQTTTDDVLEEMEPGTPYGTGELADALEIADSTANYRLNKMADEGTIEKRLISGTTAAWWVPAAGSQCAAEDCSLSAEDELRRTLGSLEYALPVCEAHAEEAHEILEE